MNKSFRHYARFTFAAVLFATAIGVAAAPARAAVTPKEVNDALAKGVAYLYSQQKNGTWEDTMTAPDQKTISTEKNAVTGGQWTGRTALAVYALLSAGEKPQEKRLAPAIEFLKSSPTYGVYALGMRMQVWLHLPQTDDVKTAAKKDFDLLIKSIKTEGSARGFYDYVKTAEGGPYSHSRSQYGVLGVWAGEQMGFEVPNAYWEVVEKGWIGHQAKDGGWTYQLPSETQNPETPGMTAVGIATLFITQDYTRPSLGCSGNVTNPAIEHGIQWMGDHMDLVATDKKFARDFHYISLYAVERIGVAAGIKYFKGVDWYQKGATWLVGKQGKSGGWTGGGLGGNVVDSAYAMLFLARGRAPVAFSKLDYDQGKTGRDAAPWNQRPRDVANLTRWLGNLFEHDLNWQVVPATAPLDDLLDSPILFIMGSQAIDLSAEGKQRLREFVSAGGTIVANADCNNSAFSMSYRKLANELFPTYEFRELPEDHPIYKTEGFPRSKWRMKPSIQSVGNGAREMMILFPNSDPSKQWQSRGVGGKEELWYMAGAVYLYATEGKQLKQFKGENNYVVADKAIKATQTLPVHRIEHAANWNAEPGSWNRLAAVSHNKIKVDLTVDSLKLGEGKLSGKGLAHVTGTAELSFTEAQRAELKKFVESGGTLLVDALGGSSRFATSAEKEIKTMFPDAELKQIPASDPLFACGGAPIESFEYRRFASRLITGASNQPHLQGIQIDGRWAVIYSREDLSVGMVGMPIDGIIGYEPQTATSIVTSIVGYVANGGKPPAAPAGKPASSKERPAAKK